MTELWPVTAFELQSKLLLAGSLYDKITKKCPVILVLISILGSLKILVAYYIYCQTLILGNYHVLASCITMNSLGH